MATRKVGRDAGSGQFIPIKQAEKDKQGAIVQRVPAPSPPAKPNKNK